ncbi:MAG: hypothetical protein B7X02_02900, partial [Rhodospirillales bacterium 12-54-5]
MPNAHGQPVITVDGTSASGKSTLAQNLAAHYGAELIQYNLFFRLIAAHMLDRGLKMGTLPTPAQIDDAHAYASTIDTHLLHEVLSDPNPQRLTRLHSEEVSCTAPYFSGIPSLLEITDKTV